MTFHSIQIHRIENPESRFVQLPGYAGLPRTSPRLLYKEETVLVRQVDATAAMLFPAKLMILHTEKPYIHRDVNPALQLLMKLKAWAQWTTRKRWMWRSPAAEVERIRLYKSSIPYVLPETLSGRLLD